MVLIILFSGFFCFSAARAASSVVINEAAWMGTGVSANNEWIEISNLGSEVADLSGWTLRAADGSPSITLTGAVTAGGYFLLERTSDETVPGATADQIYTGSLSNSGEILELRDAGGSLIDKIDASGGWPAGDNDLKLTMERRTGGGWQSSAAAGGTPKTENSGGATSPQPSPAPGEGEAVAPESAASSAAASAGQAGGGGEIKEEDNIIISEILPDPAGADSRGEFIELQNLGEQTVYLSGWRLETKNLKFEIRTDSRLVIEPKRFLALWRSDTGLPLSNQDDTVKLYAPGKSRAADSVKYKKPPTGKSYSRDGAGLSAGEAGEWYWTNHVTPGAKNYVNHEPVVEFSFDSPVIAGSPVSFDSSDTFDPDGETLAFSWDFGDGVTNGLADPEHTFLKAGSYKVKLSVKDADNLVTEEATVKVINRGAASSTVKTKTSVKSKTGSSVKGKKISGAGQTGRITARGVVLSEPGVLGSQIFYLAGEKNYQVYNYYKNFPKLKVGDEIAVTGELSNYQGEARIKTKSAGDIRIIGSGAAPEAEELACQALSEDYLGKLVKLTGEVTKKSGSTVYLDDSTDEALIYLKTSANISSKSLSVGEKLAVTGILSKTGSGLRLLPRGLDDIVKVDAASAAVEGESAKSDTWALAPRDKKAEMLEYLLIVAGGVIVVLIGLMIKYRRKLNL